MNPFRRRVKKILAAVLLLSAFYFCNAQDAVYIDSLKSELSKCTEDTNKFWLYTDIAWQYIGITPDSFMLYNRSAFQLAIKANYLKGIAKCYYNFGVNYFNQGQYEKANLMLLQAVPIFENLNNKKALAATYNCIGNVLKELKEFDLSLAYQKKALKLQMEIGARTGTCNSYVNIGNIYMEKEDNKLSESFYYQALKIALEQEDKPLCAKIYNNLGISMKNQGDYDRALDYYRLSSKIKDSMQIIAGLAITYNNMGELFTLKGNAAEAKEYFFKALSLATESSSKDDRRNAYAGLAKVYAMLKQYEDAYTYQKKYSELNDSLYVSESTKNITELQTKYDTEKKEHEIEKLSNIKTTQDMKLKQNRILIYSIGFGSVFILITVLLLFNLYKQRQSRKKMFALSIATEEKERKRFAEDLHDGLGPLLSSISLYVNELKSDRHNIKEKHDFLKYTSDLIDDSIKTTRSIANNLMPGILSDFGLVTAVNTFCGKLKRSGNINISVLAENTDKRYNPVLEITLYRVALELVNNSFKHAEPMNITMNIYDDGKFLTLQYTDDGKGFDLNKKLNDPKSGMGLKNIVNRVKSVSGSCNLFSAPSKGMKCDIRVDYRSFKS